MFGEDSDFIDIDWCGENQQSPLVVLLHGLTGSSNSKYIIGLQAELLKQNIQSVAINFRSCSGEPNLLPRSYHSGDSAELARILVFLKDRFPNRTLAAVGYSLGGNVLLKYLGESGCSSLLSSAVAISTPFRLDQCARRMNNGFSRVYRDRFLKDLHQQMQEKEQLFRDKGWQEKADVLRFYNQLGCMKTFEAFDHNITAPLHGFKSGEDYYQKASCRYYLKGIQTPTLIIHSKDDPFMQPETIPQLSELSSDTIIELTRHGGHVGFIAGSLLKPDYWLEQRIPDFLQKTLTTF